MKRSLAAIFVYLLIGSAIPCGAQYYYQNDRYYGTNVNVELGISAGIMNSLTDVGGKKGIGKGFIKDLTMKTTKPSFGLYAIAMIQEKIGARLEFTFGTVQGYDSILKSVASSTYGRYERNLSFRSTIRDIQLAIEVHPLFFKYYGEDEAPYWSPYLVAGIGYFTFNPEAQLDGRWYALQSLNLEGQGFAEYPDRKPYKLSQINFPVGVGVKYEVNSFMSARLEVVHRFLMTDYLDDVSQENYVDPALFYNYMPAARAAIAERLSYRAIDPKVAQRGDPKDNDSFFTIQLKLGIAIRSARR